ncbi:MAG: class I SAM-dependent methyltransferase [Phycisphaerales bacterium]|nr:class I SAM-dependent methyltransferase [Phycisphaerales bacterium]
MTTTRPTGDIAELQARIDAMGPWFYDIELGNGLRTRSKVSASHEDIHVTRREMVGRAVTEHFGDRLGGISALDVGCHEGFFSFLLRELGVPRIHGVDLRAESLEKARSLASISGSEGMDWTCCNCEELDQSVQDTFELCLCVGLIYHLENPIRCLRQVAARCGEMIVVETQVCDEIVGETEWGRQECRMPYQGGFALIDETCFDDNPETGATPLALCPSPKALETVLKALGFARVETITPPETGNEQMLRAKRVVVAGYR